jgi:hypothetical protein
MTDKMRGSSDLPPISFRGFCIFVLVLLQFSVVASVVAKGGNYVRTVGVNFARGYFEIPLASNIFVMLILYVFDTTLAPSKARWFALHGFANSLVVITAFNGMITSLRDPLYSLDSRVYFDKSILGSASPFVLLCSTY